VAPLSELHALKGEGVRESSPRTEDDITRIVEQTIASLEKSKRPPNDRMKRQQEEIVRVLTECKGQVGGGNGAAARMGLSRTTLIGRMKRLGINPYDYA
jgi:formate hydrogenlyase transcriptional activator